MMSNDESPTPGTSSGTSDPLPTRGSLLGRLKDWNDKESWREFFQIYHKLIYRAALKAGLTETEAQDVVQETMVGVAKKMKDFVYDPAKGSFKGWLLQLTGWRVANQFRKRQRTQPLSQEQKPGLRFPASLSEILDATATAKLEQAWDEEWHHYLTEAALARVRVRVNPKHFQIFDLSVTQHKPVREIARFLDVSTAKVYLVRHRVARLMRKEVNYLQARLE
jgi:RNA polymerase sigma factor (sigma-70 family)